jgi:hypothetical protein
MHFNSTNIFPGATIAKRKRPAESEATAAVLFAIKISAFAKGFLF